MKSKNRWARSIQRVTDIMISGKRGPGDHIGYRFDGGDPQPARSLQFGDCDPHLEQTQIERIGDECRTERPPEPLERAIETGKPAAVAARQPQARRAAPARPPAMPLSASDARPPVQERSK